MTSPADRTHPHPSRLRVGDQEREHAATALAEHYAHGRLTHGEHADRLDAAWSARTRADLDLLFHDLPTTGFGPTPPPVTVTRSTGWSGRGGHPGPSPWLLLLAIVGTVVLVSAIPFAPLLLVAFVAFVALKRHRRRVRQPADLPLWR